MPSKTTTGNLTFVGIGASAGGLEALRELFSNMPRKMPATYVVVQHISPQYKSLLSELIGRETGLVVSEIVDGITPKADHVYVTPPNHDVIVEKGVLRLRPPSTHPGAPKPSVDRFFRSLAAEVGELSLGLVLSGTGSDGALGVQAIRAAGGIVIAQSEETARYAGMPRAAVETGCVDLSLAPGEIGGKFENIIRRPRDLAGLRETGGATAEVTRITTVLRRTFGVDFNEYKSSTVLRRIERRMTALTISAIEHYASAVENDHAEAEALYRDLMISVTAFFRDHDEFALLRQALETIVSEADGATIRIWCAGCATGEEVYSVAILLADAIGGLDQLDRQPFQIFATDIDERALAVARRAAYSHEQVEVVSPDHLARYFEIENQSYVVAKRLRDRVVLSTHNVCQDPPFLNLNLITCRNLLIYLAPGMQSKILQRFHYALRPKGVLFLGKSESIAMEEDLFRQSSSGGRIFASRGAPRRPPAVQRLSTRRDMNTARMASEAERQEADEARTRFDNLVRAIGPQAILVTRNLKILRIYGGIKRYLDPTEGDVKYDVSTMIAERYRQEIRSLVRLAEHDGGARYGATLRDPGEPARREQIRVHPIDSRKEEDGLFLVSFSEWTEEAEPKQASTGDGGVNEAERELAALRKDFHALNLRHDAVCGELQAYIEELQSSNEELQSTNEEFETSNEELESTNEELTTVNDELQIKSSELAVANLDLGSILTNVSSPLIVVDFDHYVTRCSDAAIPFLEIQPRLARTHLRQCRMPKDAPDLEEIVTRVLDTGKRERVTFTDVHNVYLIDASPYSSGLDGMTIGVVILIHDQSDRQVRDELEVLFENAPLMIALTDENGQYQRANPALARAAQREPTDLIGKTRRDVFGASAAINQAEIVHQRALKTGAQQKLHTRVSLPNGQAIAIDETFIPVEIAGKPGVYTLARDVTSERDANALLADERSARERVTRMDALGQLSGGVAHDFNNLLGTIKTTVELLLAKGADEASLADYRAILRATDKGASLTRRLLSFAQPRSDAERAVDVGSTMEDVVTLLRRIIETSIDFELLPAPINTFVICDPVQLENVVLNAVLNAREALLRSEQNGRIELSADRARFEGRDGVRLMVRDDGPGMAPDVLARATEPFFSTKSPGVGAGLGLAMAQSFAHQAGGNLRIESKPKQGTRVEIWLPLAPVGITESEPTQDAFTLKGEGACILFAEDDDDLREAISVYLQRCGFEIVSARSGWEAIELLEKGVSPELLITDIVMPGGVNGFDLAVKVQAMHPEIPVVYLSGYVGSGDNSRMVVQGRLLRKPFALSTLNAAIVGAMNYEDIPEDLGTEAEGVTAK